MKIITALAIPVLTAALVMVDPGLNPDLFKPAPHQVSGASSTSSFEDITLTDLLASTLPACPSDGITEDEPTLCFYDATGDNMSGKSFIAHKGEVVFMFSA